MTWHGGWRLSGPADPCFHWPPGLTRPHPWRRSFHLLALTCPTSPPAGFIPMQIVSSAMGNEPPPAVVVKALAVAGMGSKDLLLVGGGQCGWERGTLDRVCVVEEGHYPTCSYLSHDLPTALSPPGHQGKDGPPLLGWDR